MALLGPRTGIGRYTYEIANRLTSENFTCRYFYGFYSKNLVYSAPESRANILKKYITKYPLLKKIAREIMLSSSRLFAPKFDVYWQPNFIPLDGVKSKRVVTSVHDFSFILHRDFHPSERIEYFDRYFLKNISRSDTIITGSKFTKSEILKRLEFSPKDVRVIHHGVDHDVFFVRKSIESDVSLPNKYILSVGSIEPRKNLMGLLKAYDILPFDIKNQFKLVLVGFQGWKNSEIMELIAANRDNIIYLGFISDEELARVYNQASCFVYPSLYEGFGLPPLEAMACGTPVVVSRAASLPEVCGEAALYCNPNDPADIAHQIKRLLTDNNLWQSMRQAGLTQAQKYTWEASAKAHMEVLLGDPSLRSG